MGWLEWIDRGLDVVKVAAGNTPIGAILHVIDAVVEKINDGISNESIIEFLKRASVSKWNSLTPDKIDRIIKILEE